MADGGGASGSQDLSHSVLNLTPDEKRVFGQLFQQADTEKLGVVTGEAAVKFFERTKLAPQVLGVIWQIADTENRGLLTSSGFCVVLRLIGHFQAGRDPTPELAFKPGPLPKFEGINVPSAPPPIASPPPIQPQQSGNGFGNGPIRVPPLTSDKATEYAGLFGKSGAQNGVLSGDIAKSIFEKARLPNEVLGRIWNLADTEQRGALNMTEFIVAMHLLASYKSGAMTGVPATLPAGLLEAASRRPPPPSTRPSGRPDAPPSAIPRQFTAQNTGSQRTASPLARQPWGTPPVSQQPTGNDWLINPQEKASYDNQFSKLDTTNQGFISGDQAVMFFSDSGLPEDILAQIWDLADINSEGHLNRDEFAVAMHLIKQQRGKTVSNLPPTLPPNLIPPSMRNQSRPAQQSTAPTFDNYQGVIQKASNDLFELGEGFGSAAPVHPQSTGGSAGFGHPNFGADPFGSKDASPISPQGAFPSSSRPGPQSIFKPFAPTSSFGQTLTAQATGGSAGSGAPQNRSAPAPAEEDLLGDTDPDVSKKLTHETSELANMSNQISTLRNQMQEVQQKKAVTQSDLNSTSTQKRDLELRLSQYRDQYQNQVKEVQDLEQRLHQLKEENKRTGQELAMVEGTYQDLQNRHRQLSSELDNHQRENASTKERIRQINAEINLLRPQLERMQADARQQKGLVAINKKQLATNEGERDKIKNEMSDLSRGAQSSTAGTPSASIVASPAASVTSQSTNPFFRKSPQPPAQGTMSPSGFVQSNVASPHDRFDNFFGQSFAAHSNAPPPTTFKPEQPTSNAFSVPSDSVKSSEGRDIPTPSTSPPVSSYQDSPRAPESQAPPENRQLASRDLPLRDNLPRNESFSSSVRVQTPASRYGPSGTETPTMFGGPAPHQGIERTDTSKTQSGKFGSPAPSVSSDAGRPTSKSEDRRDIFQSFGPPSITSAHIPGAFPGEGQGPLQPNPTGDSTLSDRSKASKLSESFSAGRSDPFSTAPTQQRAPSSSKADFDSAFSAFGPRPQERQNTGSSVGGGLDTNAAATKFAREFPPIATLEEDDDSDSNSERGFGDNKFGGGYSPKADRSSIGGQSQGQSQTQPKPAPTITQGSSSSPFDTRPSQNLQTQPSASELPTPGAQKSPPPYDQAMNTNRSGGRDSNQFPPEFSGLLPSREDPTTTPHSVPSGSQQPDKQAVFSSAAAPGGQGQALFGIGPSLSQPKSSVFSTSPPQQSDTPASTVASDQYHTAQSSYATSGDKPTSPTTAQPPQQTSSKPAATYDDFDSGFDDLADAKEADDRADDDFLFSSHHREGLDEFNPTFDSPIASKSNTMHSDQTPTTRSGHLDTSFGDFDQHIAQSFSSAGKAPQQPTASTSHDWDAIFSNLDSSGSGAKPEADNHKSASAFPEPASPLPQQQQQQGSLKETAGPSSSSATAQMPQLGRALTSGTEHDDPILKKLTGMGYPRNEALSALENFDYDINKAADYLTSSRSMS